MTRGVTLFVCVTAALAMSDEVRRPLTNDDVIRLVRAGFTEPVILQAVETNPVRFDLSREALASLRSAGVGDAVITAMSSARPQPGYLKLLDSGIYVKRGDAYALVDGERVVWRKLTPESEGEIARIVMAGAVGNRQSRLILTPPVELLIVAPPDTPVSAYQLLRAEERQDSREFRVEAAVRDGVVLGFTGRTTVAATVDASFDLGVRVFLNQPRKGEYGIASSRRLLADSKICTFTIE